MRKMMITTLMGVALAAPVAHADLPALTIEMARQWAAANMPLLSDDSAMIQQRCDIGSPNQTDIIAEAQIERVLPSTIWLRRNDAALARCLPSAPLTNH
jgi:hypothetical protein